MSPEQRADRFMSWLDRHDRGIANNSIHHTVARAIRAAENATLERAAKSVDRISDARAEHGAHVVAHAYGHAAEVVRSLKSRAPRKAVK